MRNDDVRRLAIPYWPSWRVARLVDQRLQSAEAEAASIVAQLEPRMIQHHPAQARDAEQRRGCKLDGEMGRDQGGTPRRSKDKRALNAASIQSRQLDDRRYSEPSQVFDGDLGAERVAVEPSSHQRSGAKQQPAGRNEQKGGVQTPQENGALITADLTAFGLKGRFTFRSGRRSSSNGARVCDDRLDQELSR